MDGGVLSKALDQLWKYFHDQMITSSTSLSTPLPAYNGVAMLTALAEAKDNQSFDIRARAKQISDQYTEEKQRLDLDLMVLRARQKQTLQRKLLQRKTNDGRLQQSFERPGRDQAIIRIMDPSQAKESTPSKSKPVDHSMASRGLNLNPMMRLRK